MQYLDFVELLRVPKSIFATASVSRVGILIDLPDRPSLWCIPLTTKQAGSQKCQHDSFFLPPCPTLVLQSWQWLRNLSVECHKPDEVTVDQLECHKPDEVTVDQLECHKPDEVTVDQLECHKPDEVTVDQLECNKPDEPSIVLCTSDPTPSSARFNETSLLLGKLSVLSDLKDVFLQQFRSLQLRSSGPTVYIVTPTYRRPAQIADLTRLAQTLMNVNYIFWLVVEDGEVSDGDEDVVVTSGKNASARIGSGERGTQKFTRNCSILIFISPSHPPLFSPFLFIFLLHLTPPHLPPPPVSSPHLPPSLVSSPHFPPSLVSSPHLPPSLVSSPHLPPPSAPSPTTFLRCRRAALEWLREHDKRGVLYFADDDNTYDIRLFDQIRRTERVSVFPVGMILDYGISSPIVRHHKVVGFHDAFQVSIHDAFQVTIHNAFQVTIHDAFQVTIHDAFQVSIHDAFQVTIHDAFQVSIHDAFQVSIHDAFQARRTFALDMAGFAVNLELVRSHPDATIPLQVSYLEDGFLRSLDISLDDLEPLAHDCTQVLVWHTRTVPPSAPNVHHIPPNANDTNLPSLYAHLLA
ncbi:Glycosyl transferase family 43 [Trinorchestia longiramus]|nr:Glycosyl transferase family 43 [Trinorchestia longiramus]